ncbi:MAG: MFS transporter, partial [Candidatus Saccharimonadales bacterium]
MVFSQSFKKWLPLVVLSLALTIIIIDTTVLNVSFRAIVDDLHANIQDIQWAITAYALVVASFTIVGGRFGDFFGRRKMFMLGAVIFALGSLLTSASTSVGMMIVMRVVQGFGAALILPATVSLLVSHYQGRDRQIAFGVWGGLAAASAALGPLLGGWLTTYWSWRWAFRINLGVAALLLLGSWVIREARDTEEKIWIDYGGIAFSVLGLLAVVYGVIESSTYGWWTAKQPFALFGQTIAGFGTISIVPAFIVIGIIFLELFVLWESRVQKMGKTPLVSFSLFKNKQFSVAVAVTAILALVQTGVFFSIPVFLQGVKHLNAVQTGVTLLPMTLAILVAAPFSAYIAKHITPKRIIQTGLVMNAVGFLMMRYELSVTSGQWALTPGFIVTGIGMGFLFSQISNMALSAVSVQQ